MTHILVKWPDLKWDVYPSRVISDTKVALELLSNKNAMTKLYGKSVLIKWKEGEPAAEAKLLGFGTMRQMERKRTEAASKKNDESADDNSSDSGSDDEGENPPKKLKEGGCSCEATEKVSKLEERMQQVENQLEEARNKLEEARNNCDALELTRNLRKVTKRLEMLVEKAQEPPPTAVLAPQVDIGGGVTIDKAVLDRLDVFCRGQPTKYARHLLRNIFTTEELEGKSLSGKSSNANKGAGAKAGLDPVRLNAVISYTCSKFEVAQQVIKASLSSLVSREIKPKQG